VFALYRRRKTTQRKVGLIGVEGKDRIARQIGRCHSKPRNRDCLARAVDLELPLLRRWQHKTCDP
jgi:hypothetical protein